MARLDGKVIAITGAGRGQGRSHAVRAAEEGADIIGIDICANIDENQYDLSSRDDLEETARLVKAAGRRMVGLEADVRDLRGITEAIDRGVEEFGKLDGVVANAGICSPSNDDPAAFFQTVNVIFNGVANTLTATQPHLKRGASIVATGSIAAMAVRPSGLEAYSPAGMEGYIWAKRAVASFMHDVAEMYGKHGIRANAVHPSNVNTPMLHSQTMYDVFRPDLEAPGYEDVKNTFSSLHALNVPYIEAVDVSEAVIYLLSDESRFVTGTQHRVDAGAYVHQRPQAPYF